MRIRNLTVLTVILFSAFGGSLDAHSFFSCETMMVRPSGDCPCDMRNPLPKALSQSVFQETSSGRAFFSGTQNQPEDPLNFVEVDNVRGLSPRKSLPEEKLYDLYSDYRV